MSLRTGWAAIQAVAERIAERNGNVRDRMITWDPDAEGGDSKVVRLIDEAPIVVGIHQWVKCKDGRSRHFTCASELDEKRTCYICSNMTTETADGRIIPLSPKTVGVGMVALREEVRENGETRIVDKLVDVKIPIDKEGLTEELEALGVTVAGDTAIGVPDVGIVRQSVGNFWASFNAYYGRYGSANDRDYRVTREGTGVDTTYIVMPCDQDNNLIDPEAVADRYRAAQLLRTPIIEYLERMGSEDYYERHIIPGEGDTPEAQAFSQGRTLADLRAKAAAEGKTQDTTNNPDPDEDPQADKYVSLMDRLNKLNS